MSDLNDVILAEGDEARKKVEEKSVKREKIAYVKLKDGEQLRGFLLASKFVMYYNHGDFERKIPSHVCADPKNGKSCLSCQNGVKRDKKTVIPFYNVDTKQIEIFDASGRASKAVYSFIDEYGDDASDTAITLKRSGSGTDTAYSIIPIPPKTVEKSRDLFTVPADVLALQERGDDGKVTLKREYYAAFLQPASDEYVRKILGLDAGTPAETSSALPDVANGTETF